MKKNVIRETIHNDLSLYDLFDGYSFEEVIKKIKSLEYVIVRTYPKYSNFKFCLEHSFNYSIINIMGERPETDIEYERRVKLEGKIADKKALSIKKKKEKLIREAKRLGLTIQED